MGEGQQQQGRLRGLVVAVVATMTGVTGTALLIGSTATAPSAAAVQSSAAVAGPTTASARVAARTTARWSGAVRTSSRSAVNAAYRSRYAPFLNQSTGYVGNALSCALGSQSVGSRAGTLSALNFVRSLGGLAPVSFSPTLNARAQSTAMLMSANQTLSHYPTSNWRCYTATGASNAARSNLAMSFPRITSGSAIGLYMSEPGGNNTAVGHRRWLLNPNALQMGSGATDNANAITVMGPTSAARPNPAYVAWPTAGYFPRPMEPAGRWSLSAGDPNTRFGAARVAVAKWNGSRWVAQRVTKYRVQDGFARPTVVWQLGSRVDQTGVYRMTVSNIRKAGTTRAFTHRYVTRMFTPWG